MDMDSTTTLFHQARGVKLAFTKVVGKAIFSIGRTSHTEQGGLVSYKFQNQTEGIYREIYLENHRIVGAICHGVWQDISYVLNSIGPWHLALFAQEGNLCLPQSAGVSYKNSIVCKCTGITRGQLQQAMLAGCENASELSDRTGASKVCGSCAPLLADIAGHTGYKLVDIIESIRVNKDVKSFCFRPKHSDALPSLPGQHIRIEGLIQGKWIQRTYTLTSPTGQTDYYEITVKRLPSGIFSCWLHDESGIESLVRVSEPQGGFDFPIKNVEPLVFFSGGIGITPALSTIRRLQIVPEKPIHIDYSAVKAEDFVYVDEFKSAAKISDNVDVVLRNTDEHARLQQSDITKLTQIYPQAHFIICGPPPYQASIKDFLYKEDVPDGCIHIENFSPHGGELAPPTGIASKTISYVLASITLLASLLYASLPSLQETTSVQEIGGIDLLWSDFIAKQISGYALLGLCVLALVVSLRKRIKKIKWGRFANWRLFHVSLGVLMITFLFAHTGFALESNFNMALMLTFLSVLVLGSVTMVLKLKPANESNMKLHKFQETSNLMHILATAVLPSLLAIHVFTAYYF